MALRLPCKCKVLSSIPGTEKKKEEGLVDYDPLKGTKFIDTVVGTAGHARHVGLLAHAQDKRHRVCHLL